MNVTQRKLIPGIGTGLDLWLLVLLTGAVACDDTSAAPSTQPDTFTATLTSPSGPEGGALVEVTGPVSEVTQGTGQLFSAVDGPATRILIVMGEAGTIRFDVGVPDIGAQLEYTILQVSGPDDELRTDLSGYTLEFTP